MSARSLTPLTWIQLHVRKVPRFVRVSPPGEITNGPMKITKEWRIILSKMGEPVERTDPKRFCFDYSYQSTTTSTSY